MKMKYSIGLSLSLFLMISLSSCQLTNKYSTPELATDTLFGDIPSTDTTSLASIPWKEYFADPYLQQLISEALDNNFDLKIAVTSIEQAEASLSMAKAAYFPSVSLVGNVEHTRFSQGARGKDVLGYHNNTYTLGVATSWELDVWGKLSRQSKASYAQFLASHTYRNLIQTSLLANLASSYYTLLALDQQLAVTHEILEIMQDNTQSMESMMQGGMLTAAAVEQSKALYYGTLVSIPALESQIKEVENSVCLLVGRNPGTVQRSSLDEQTVPSSLLYGVPAQMLAKRPDVLMAELQFRSAFEVTQAAQASFYPSLTLTSGTLGFTAGSLSAFFKPENIFASIVGGLTQPVFARKQLTTQLKVAKAQQQEALLNFEKTVLTAGNEVSGILYSYESSLKKNPVRDEQIASLVKAVEYTQELLKAGEANYTEVLTAEQSYLQALLNKVSDKLEQLQSSVSLYRALGGGVE